MEQTYINKQVTPVVDGIVCPLDGGTLQTEQVPESCAFTALFDDYHVLRTPLVLLKVLDVLHCCLKVGFTVLRKHLVSHPDPGAILCLHDKGAPRVKHFALSGGALTSLHV
jgi:hypothetical protein